MVIVSIVILQTTSHCVNKSRFDIHVVTFFYPVDYEKLRTFVVTFDAASVITFKIFLDILKYLNRTYSHGIPIHGGKSRQYVDLLLNNIYCIRIFCGSNVSNTLLHLCCP